MSRTAIVLFNLGGPDRPQSVRPFLFNLFNDPAIIRLPSPVRWLLAHLIAWRRARKARAIYDQLGGGSPLLANTVAQALALSRACKDPGSVKVFVAMRHWNPLTPISVRAVKEMAPERVVLLPLYPQFSTTTTLSSHQAWMLEAGRQGLDCPHHLVCCYPTLRGFVVALAKLAKEGLIEARAKAPDARPLVIFSAHGLPRRIVVAGDPYQKQVEASAAAVAAELGLADGDWMIAYQSRVGPLEWIGPACDAAIVEASRAGRAIVLVPIAFVSEHSETLVELDIDYRHLAEHHRAPAYVRVSTVGTHPDFINGLADLVGMAGGDARGDARGDSGPVAPGAGSQACAGSKGCPHRQGAGGKP